MVTRKSFAEALFQLLSPSKQFSSSYGWFGGHTYFQNVLFCYEIDVKKHFFWKLFFYMEFILDSRLIWSFRLRIYGKSDYLKRWIEFVKLVMLSLQAVCSLSFLNLRIAF